MQCVRVRSMIGRASRSNSARVSVHEKLRPSVTNGSSMLAVSFDDSVCFAAMAASRRRGVMDASAEIRAARSPTMAASISSPPRRVLPFVASTWNTPALSSRIEMSNVPPPRSNTAIFDFSRSRSRPYASAAAVGSFTMRSTVSPASSPARLVALRCESLKYAGTVITARVTGSPRARSASARSFLRTSADTSSGASSLPCA